MSRLLQYLEQNGILLCNAPQAARAGGYRVWLERRNRADRPARAVLLQGIQEADHIFIQRNPLFIRESPAEKAIDTGGSEDILYTGGWYGS